MSKTGVWRWVSLGLAFIVAGCFAAAAQTPYQPKFPGDPARSDSEAQALGYMRVVIRAQKLRVQILRAIRDKTCCHARAEALIRAGGTAQPSRAHSTSAAITMNAATTST